MLDTLTVKIPCQLVLVDWILYIWPSFCILFLLCLHPSALKLRIYEFVVWSPSRHISLFLLSTTPKESWLILCPRQHLSATSLLRYSFLHHHHHNPWYILQDILFPVHSATHAKHVLRPYKTFYVASTRSPLLQVQKGKLWDSCKEELLTKSLTKLKKGEQISLIARRSFL